MKYLLRGRAAFKGVVTKNSKKAKDIISKNSSRMVLRSVKERVLKALQDASKAMQDVGAGHFFWHSIVLTASKTDLPLTNPF